MARFLRAPAAGVVLTAALLACSQQSGGGAAPTTCPAWAPNAGSACSNGGTECVFPGDPTNPCATTPTFVCQGGVWADITPDGGVNQLAVCPPTAPPEGAACPRCAPVYQCTYNGACDPDGGPSETATCSAQHWAVVSTACGDAAPE